MASYRALKPVVIEGQRRDAGETFEADPDLIGALASRGFIKVEEPKDEPKPKAKPRSKRKQT